MPTLPPHKWGMDWWCIEMPMFRPWNLLSWNFQYNLVFCWLEAEFLWNFRRWNSKFRAWNLANPSTTIPYHTSSLPTSVLIAEKIASGFWSQGNRASKILGPSNGANCAGSRSRFWCTQVQTAYKGGLPDKINQKVLRSFSQFFFAGQKGHSGVFCTIPTGISTFWIPGDSLTYVYSHWIQMHLPGIFFAYVYSHLLRDEFLRYVYLIQDRWCSEFFTYVLRELESYILRGTPKPWQLKAPGPKPTIKQLEKASKGDGWHRKRTRWPCKGNGPPPVRGTDGPFNYRKRL